MPRWLSIIAFSIFGSFLTTLAFIVALHETLPPTDGAYGIPFPEYLLSPITWMVALPVMGVAALVAFILGLFCFRDRSIVRCASFVIGMTVVFTGGLTAIAPLYGLIGAPLTLLISLLICAFSGHPFLRESNSRGS